MKESSIDGNDIINFILGPSAAWQQPETKPAKDDAVNIGYGNIKKNELTINATKIDAQNHKFASYTNIYDMIRSEIPGVRIDGNGTIYLMEPSSLINSNEPLIIVDGATVSNLDNIEPSMVKSIDILKGAAASIYGTRGSNGVILITLKRGERKK
jgi:TonB-dependent SusC/RagA subfamily outer membrane receptor